MNKNEKVFPSKEKILKDESNKNEKIEKIKKNNFHNENSMKEINKNLTNKCFHKLTIKDKVKSQKHFNELSKIDKKKESNNRNLNRIDITMNFNLTNFTTFNETNKLLDKKLIENYSGKKEISHKRQISDGFQKLKVINTGNFVNIKVNTKDNKTSTNKEIQNIKKLNKNNKNNFIKYDISEYEKINNTNNYIYNSHQDLSLYEKISKLKINVSDLSNKKDFKKIIGEKKYIKINNGNSKNSSTHMNLNLNSTKSTTNLIKKEKSTNTNIINNINIDRNIFSKKIMITNKSFKYKTFKNNISESKKNLKNNTSKKIVVPNEIREKINKNENKCDIISPNKNIKIFPINSKKNIKYNINKSCDTFNNINNNIKGKKIYKKVGINLNNTSRNNSNRENLNFFTDKNKKIENEKILGENKEKEDDDISPEMNFFNIVKLIQKSKNLVY